MCERLDKLSSTRTEGDELNSARGLLSQSCKNVMRQFALNPQPYVEMRKIFIEEKSEPGVTDSNLEYIASLKGILISKNQITLQLDI